MWQLSPAGAAVQAQTHTSASRVQVLHGGRVIHELSVYGSAEQEQDNRSHLLSSSVDAEVGRPILRTGTVSLVDAGGDLSLTDARELFSPYDAEFAVWRGPVLRSGAVDWAPLGRFRATQADTSDSPSGTVINLTLQDLSLIYDVNLPGPVTIPARTPAEQAIGLILSRVNRGFSWDPWRTGLTVGPLLYDSSDNALEAALDIAVSVGGWFHHDRLGEPILAPFGAATRAPSQRFADTLLSVSKGEDADEIYNSVLMRSSDSAAGVVEGLAQDLNPNSPTYVGRGIRQLTVVNQHLATVDQAKQAAAARLLLELGRSETVSWECVPDVRTDPEDAVTVHRERAGVYERRVVVSALSLSLDVTGSMTVTGRRAVAGEEGNV